MTSQKLSEDDLLYYIAETGKFGQRVGLTNIFMSAIAHPADLPPLLQSLADKKLIDILPQKNLLDEFTRLADKVKDREGPQPIKVDQNMRNALAQRGVNVNVGDTIIDAGQAVSRLNYLLHKEAGRSNMVQGHIRITAEGEKKAATIPRPPQFN